MTALQKYYYHPEDFSITGIEVPSITADHIENYPSVVDRFFTKYFYVKTCSNPQPYKVLFHSNRICMISLAPEHEALKVGVKSITFDIGNTNRSQNVVKGKGKKGGMVLQHDSAIAIITDNNDVTYKVPSCIQGKLIEVNERVVKDVSLLGIEGDGYIAVVLPKPEHCDEIKSSLMTEEQYLSSVQK